MHVKLIILIAATSLIACNDKIIHHHKGEPKYTFVFKPQTNSKYYYLIDNKADLHFKFQNKKVENKNDIILGFIYEINKDTLGNFLFTTTFDSLHVIKQTSDNKTELDAANGTYSLDPIERMLSILKGKSIIVVIDKNGKVISTKGYQEMSNKIISQMNVEDEAEKIQIQSQLASMIGQDFAKNNVEQGFTIFPDTAVYVGDTWTKNVTTSTGLGLNFYSTYKLLSVDNNIANIKSISTIKSENATINVNGSQTEANLKGDENGKMKVDLKTGMLVTLGSKISVDGSFKVLGSDVPVNIEIEKEIKGRRL